jgi:hypothetical protein
MPSNQVFRCSQLCMPPMHAGVRPADYHMVVYRWRSADNVQRCGHHARDTRAAVAVRCKIAYCPKEAVKLVEKLPAFIYSETGLYTYTTCCGGPL